MKLNIVPLLYLYLSVGVIFIHTLASSDTYMLRITTVTKNCSVAHVNLVKLYQFK